MNRMVYRKRSRVDPRESGNGHADTEPAGVRRIMVRAGREVGHLDDEIVRLTRSRPLVALCAALAAGFILGRVLSKR